MIFYFFFFNLNTDFFSKSDFILIPYEIDEKLNIFEAIILFPELISDFSQKEYSLIHTDMNN